MTRQPPHSRNVSAASRVFDLRPSRTLIALTAAFHTALVAGVTLVPGATIVPRLLGGAGIVGAMAWSVSRHLLPGRGRAPVRLVVNAHGHWWLEWGPGETLSASLTHALVGNHACVLMFRGGDGRSRRVVVSRDMLATDAHRHLRRLLLAARSAT